MKKIILAFLLSTSFASAQVLDIGPGPVVTTPTVFTNSIAADVTLNNTGTFFTGPTVAQGTVGYFCAFGTVNVIDSGGVSNFTGQLTDGTTVIDSVTIGGALAVREAIPLSGCILNPVGNIRILVKDNVVTGRMIANDSGLGKDSTVTVVLQH